MKYNLPKTLSTYTNVTSVLKKEIDNLGIYLRRSRHRRRVLSLNNLLATRLILAVMVVVVIVVVVSVVVKVLILILYSIYLYFLNRFTHR